MSLTFQFREIPELIGVCVGVCGLVGASHGDGVTAANDDGFKL